MIPRAAVLGPTLALVLAGAYFVVEDLTRYLIRRSRSSVARFRDARAAMARASAANRWLP